MPVGTRVETRQASGGRALADEEWEETLAAFTRRHRSRTARLEVRDDGRGRHALVEDLPFLAISLDDDEGPTQVVIECGDARAGQAGTVRHVLQDPTAIRAFSSSAGDCLEIELRGEAAVILTLCG